MIIPFTNWHLKAYGLSLGLGFITATTFALPFVSESERELYGTGDFDGNKQTDVVVVDKTTGKYRLGYGQPDGSLKWTPYRFCGFKDVTAMTVGKLLQPGSDAIVFSSGDGNQVALGNVSNPAAAAEPLPIEPPGLGPNSVVAVDIPGDGNTDLDDLCVGSIYNDPHPVLCSLMRNTAGTLSKMADDKLDAPSRRANAIRLKSPDGKICIGGLLAGQEEDSLRLAEARLPGLKPVAGIGGLPQGSDYALGHFRNPTLADFIVFKRGEKSLLFRPVEEAEGKLSIGAGASYDMGQPISQVFVLSPDKASKLLVLFGKGESAAIYDFDGASAPKETKKLAPEGSELFSGATVLNDKFLVYSWTATSKYSTKHRIFDLAGNPKGSTTLLPSLQDSDDSTAGDIHKRIVANLKETSEGDMKLYTNTIPGTDVNFVMVPIKGGQFLMGSPEAETKRKADEGPQHKVKIEPFWMGQCEISWNEYELFMYPDDEKKRRENSPTEEYVNKVSDAVTRPSKPYVEMSFGMGKNGFPAIAMTHHAANKYCHWLSAKTGQFYRLPTEAEWEYACRAGTTTAYSFGDDASKLAEHGWFTDNSDFKYQKVGKKKANPWGLHDMHGNVLEWVLDQYDPEYYKTVKDAVTAEPWNKATKPYPHAVRGGSWDDDGALLRSAARRGSERAWKMQDPQMPKSIWWFSDAQFIGFRIIRPLKVPPPQELVKYWTSGTEKE